MAAKLTDPKKTATVHNLAERKARGAGGQKRSGKPVNRLKAAAHEAKAPPKSAPRAASPEDQAAIDAQARKAQVERVAALTNQHRIHDNKIEAVKLTLTELNGEKKLIRTAIQNSGVRLEVFDERYEKLKLKTKRTDLAAIERERAICSEAMGLQVGEQAEMEFAKLPEGVKSAEHWRFEGYKAGVAGEACDPVKAECPPENTQAYSQGWGEGQTVIAAGMKQLKADKPKPAALPLVDAAPQGDGAAGKGEEEPKIASQPDWSGFGDDPQDWSVQQRTIFRDWFSGLHPDDVVELEHVGAELCFDLMNDGKDPFAGTSSALQ